MGVANFFNRLKEKNGPLSSDQLFQKIVSSAQDNIDKLKTSLKTGVIQNKGAFCLASILSGGLLGVGAPAIVSGLPFVLLLAGILHTDVQTAKDMVAKLAAPNNREPNKRRSGINFSSRVIAKKREDVLTAYLNS